MKKRYSLTPFIVFSMIFCPGAAKNANATSHIVEVGSPGNSFTPASFTAYAGDTIRFAYSSGFHTTTSTMIPNGAVSWDEYLINPGDTFDYVPAVTGTYDYYCVIHGAAMSASFQVAMPLPIKMSLLEGIIVNERYIKLSWKTYSEDNNDYFEIQRSEDGLKFTAVEKQSSKANEGNSAQTIIYGFTDKKPVNQRVYYRLHQVDIDGKSSYSNVIYIALKGDKDIILRLHPNPAKSSVMVHLQGNMDGSAEVQLTDLSGKIIQRIPIKTVEEMPAFDISKLMPGAYIVKFIDYTKVVTEKLIIE